MVDQNQIIELIKTGLPIVATSPVLAKLIDVVGDVIKTLYLPTLTLKKGKAEVDVEIYRQKQQGELLDQQTFTLYEVAKLKNFVKTASFASEYLENIEVVSDNPVDFDWIMRFFDAIGSISNEELQKLWSKVLCGEIINPGNISLRTLDAIRNVSQKEAEIFNELCQLILISGDCYFINSNGFYQHNDSNQRSKKIIAEKGYVYSTHIIPLIEAGLLSIDNSLATDFSTDKTLLMYNKDTIVFIIAQNENAPAISIDAYFLTSCGIELFNVISSNDDFAPNNKYVNACFEEFKEEYPDLVVVIQDKEGLD